MRILILQRLIAAGLGFIWAGLFFVQVVQGPSLREQAEKNRIRLIHLPGPRGPILDRHGVPLVEDRVGFELAVFPQELKDPSETWARLHPIVGLPIDDLAQRYRKGYLAPFTPVPLLKDLPAQTAFLLEEEKGTLPGTLIRPMPRRHYLLGKALGPVAGYVGLIDAAELARQKSYGYTFRDWVGKDGLEQVYDRYLRGKDGGLQVEVDAKGRLVRQIGFRRPIRGRRITVSLDGRLQNFSHRLLEDRMGALILMETATGEILSLVSRPTFDPNAFVDSTRRQDVRYALRHPSRPMFNRAVRAAVAPGSIFKVVTAYEALQEGKIDAHTAFACSGSYSLGTGLFRCWREEGHGNQSVSEALEHSCNVFFYSTGRRLGVEGIAEGARRFGLGHLTGIDLPRETAGLVPDRAWMSQVLKQPWQEGDTLSLAIGQSALQVTPIQMLRLITAVATGGSVPQPHLLKQIEGESAPLRWPVTRISLDREALAEVKAGLERVVASPTGTGRLAQLPGITAAGKTGTAQVSQGETHAWFLGYAPAESPRLAFVVFLEHGGKGGEDAALVVRDLLAYLRELEYL